MAMNIAPQTEFTGEGRPNGTKVGKPAPSLEELAGKFPQLEILELLGQGGMGAVYKARQKELDRIVALKILPPSAGGSPAFAERFAREAKALARLNHPNIVTLYEFGRADDLFFFLMEFVDGVNLRQLLKTGRVSPREALAIVPQICDALQYAHDEGVVHRDIKPENILMDRKGRMKVADFGIARLMKLGPEPATGSVAQTPGETLLTEAGNVMGTPQYMAPEQKEHPGEVDHRADIYALGVVFYQMLTGELPGKQIEAPSKKAQIDVRLDEVVLRALEKNPERRYQTAAEFRTRVETAAGDLNPPAIPSETAGTEQSADTGPRNPNPSIPPSIMNRTFENLYRQLGRTTIAALIIGLLFLGLALSTSLLGIQRPAAGFGDAASLFGYVFIALLALFLITSIIAVFIRWHDRGQMNASFEVFRRQLGRATLAVLVIGLACLALALLFALIGLPDVVAGFNRATWFIGRVFLVLLGLFLTTSLIGALLRWLDRRYC
jgi:serine/threonine protein kinase